MYCWLKKHLDPICPLFAIVPLVSCFVFNMIIYNGTMVLCSDWHHYDLTTCLEDAVPLIPEWMYIYWGCFVFWIINYIMIGRINREDKASFYRFIITDMSSRIVCAFFFIFFPTANTRPDVPIEGFSTWLLNFLYQIDQPTNLFPSIHCLVSWLSFIGIRKSNKVPFWYKTASCVMALLVVLSTQFTKQHFWIDAVAGISLAEILFFINNRINAYRHVERFFGWINQKLFHLFKGELCE